MGPVPAFRVDHTIRRSDEIRHPGLSDRAVHCNIGLCSDTGRLCLFPRPEPSRVRLRVERHFEWHQPNRFNLRVRRLRAKVNASESMA